MHTSMKVMMLDTVTDMKKKSNTNVLSLIIFAYSFTHSWTYFIEPIKILGYFLLH